jgi:mono/diheme cytochrome c family protein
MSDESNKKINARYERELQKGERFWPDSLFKDAIMALAIFLVLILLATFVGIASDPKADPSDSAYVPRPEWYFLFLFKFLALYGQIPLLGKIEWLATVIIPGFAILLLILLPFIDKSPDRYYGKRVLPISLMGIFVTSTITLTMMSDVPTGATLVGMLQTIGGLVIPGLAMVALVMMSFVFKNVSTKVMVWTAVTACVLMVVFMAATLALAPAPVVTEEVTVATTLEDQIVAGQDLYSINCVECHGDDGSVTKIEGVEGLEGKEIPPINGKDILYTLNDAAMAEVIAYGRPDAGMNPFGKAYNPEGISRAEIDYIVTFMRYSWDDRFEKPVMKPLFPALAESEVPSYEVHIAPIVKRYCISCHRAGKDNHNYLMGSYEDILNTGDEKDKNIIAGDMNSYLLQIIQDTPIPDPNKPGENLIGVMPPKSHLKPDVIEVFRRWILMGMPNSAADAANLVMPTPTPTSTPTPQP